VATYLVARTSDDFAPAYYLMGVALISFVATLGLPEPAAGRELDQPAPPAPAGPASA
jgi:hypothetical protein